MDTRGNSRVIYARAFASTSFEPEACDSFMADAAVRAYQGLDTEHEAHGLPSLEPDRDHMLVCHRANRNGSERARLHEKRVFVSAIIGLESKNRRRGKLRSKMVTLGNVARECAHGGPYESGLKRGCLLASSCRTRRPGSAAASCVPRWPPRWPKRRNGAVAKTRDGTRHEYRPAFAFISLSGDFTRSPARGRERAGHPGGAFAARHLHDPISAYRRSLFDVALHHGAITRWGEETTRRLQEWPRAGSGIAR
jgi:hypothetical protein